MHACLTVVRGLKMSNKYLHIAVSTKRNRLNITEIIYYNNRGTIMKPQKVDRGLSILNI